MVSTITVPEVVRRRVKRISSILDIPQYRVIEMLLDLYEDELKLRVQPADGRVLEELVKASRKVRSEDPVWARRAAALEEAVARGLTPMVFRGRWGLEVEVNA